jgi:phosphoglycerate dehydrogenase-like enzyme
MSEFPAVAVHNLHHNAGPVAEHAVALLLAAAKFIVPMDRSLRANDWTVRYQSSPSVILEGKTALILGYGAIGQRVAKLCLGLGMEVIAVRRTAEASHSDSVCCTPIESLPDLLPQATALLICLPHTPETTGLIGHKELSRLPRHAILVNIGRGPIVDEKALYHALQDGTLYAAGLDVWYNYPENKPARASTPPSAYPFHELPNVVMSPHRAGSSQETETLRMSYLAELLNAAARGDPIPNRVDLERGY